MDGKHWKTHNSAGSRRVVVTKELPGDRWLRILAGADCRVEACTSTNILDTGEIAVAIGDACAGVIGQLTETWGEDLFAALASAGGRVYSNYAVGYDNVDLEAATRYGICVGNTPGVLTETTAEMAVALTFAAARRLVEADRFMRSGRYAGWLPTLFLGELLWRKTLGVVGLGRIGSAYARMMVEGHKMDLLYCDPRPQDMLETRIAAYNDYLARQGDRPVSCRRVESVEAILPNADVVSLHTPLDPGTRHLMDGKRLSMMRENAVLVNTSRGPVIDERALVEHCRKHPDFRVGLDVYEREPDMEPGLRDLDNVVILPHIASATRWTREGMAVLAACNVAGILKGYPVWRGPDISVFLQEGEIPRAAPSILNAGELGLGFFEGR